MDALTFLSSIVASLAWPVTTLTVLVILFANRRAFSRFVKSIRYKDVEISLREDFEEAKEIAQGIAPMLAQPEGRDRPQDAEDMVLRLASIDPGVAILKSWQRLESKLIQLIQHNGLVRFTNPDKFMRQLGELGKLERQDVALYERMRRIRNEVVHVGFQRPLVSIAEVVEYDGLVNTLVARLEQVRQEPGYVGPEGGT